MSSCGATYRLIACSDKLYSFKICNNFHTHEKNYINFASSLEHVPLCKSKNKNPTITPSKPMELSYVISYRCLNLISCEDRGFVLMMNLLDLSTNHKLSPSRIYKLVNMWVVHCKICPSLLTLSWWNGMTFNYEMVVILTSQQVYSGP